MARKQKLWEHSPENKAPKTTARINPSWGHVGAMSDTLQYVGPASLHYSATPPLPSTYF